MAEFELFGDNDSGGGRKSKKLTKKQWFLIACAVVGGIAIFLGYKKYNSSSADTTGYEAIGYGGYPTVGGTEGASDSVMDFLLDYQESNNQAMADLFDQMIQNDQALLDLIAGQDQAGNNNDYFSRGYTTPATITFLQDTASEKQAVLDQMKANSDAWHVVNNPTLQAQLAEENQKLGASIGLSYDANSGTWWDGGSIAYITPTQLNAAEEQKTVGNADYASTWVPNTDYQARINEAILKGSDATTINTLNSQRNAKINATGSSLAKANSTYDPNADYTTLIRQAKESGASQSVIDNLTAQRNAKIAANPELEKYRNDV